MVTLVVNLVYRERQACSASSAGQQVIDLLVYLCTDGKGRPHAVAGVLDVVPCYHQWLSISVHGVSEHVSLMGNDHSYALC